MKLLVAVALAALSSGCAVARMQDARADYARSADAYKQCLTANASAPQRCEGLRLAMETDERRYKNFSSDLRPANQRSYDVTITNR